MLHLDFCLLTKVTAHLCEREMTNSNMKESYIEKKPRRHKTWDNRSESLKAVAYVIKS